MPMTIKRAATTRVEEEIGNAGAPPQDNQDHPQGDNAQSFLQI